MHELCLVGQQAPQHLCIKEGHGTHAIMQAPQHLCIKDGHGTHAIMQL